MMINHQQILSSGYVYVPHWVSIHGIYPMDFVLTFGEGGKGGTTRFLVVLHAHGHAAKHVAVVLVSLFSVIHELVQSVGSYTILRCLDWHTNKVPINYPSHSHAQPPSAQPPPQWREQEINKVRRFSSRSVIDFLTSGGKFGSFSLVSIMRLSTVSSRTTTPIGSHVQDE